MFWILQYKYSSTTPDPHHDCQMWFAKENKHEPVFLFHPHCTLLLFLGCREEFLLRSHFWKHGREE